MGFNVVFYSFIVYVLGGPSKLSTCPGIIHYCWVSNRGSRLHFIIKCWNIFLTSSTKSITLLTNPPALYTLEGLFRPLEELLEHLITESLAIQGGDERGKLIIFSFN